MRDLKRSNALLPAYKQLSQAGMEVFTPMVSRVFSRNGKRIRKKDLITLNEVLNSGSSIDLYQEENTGLWATYGYSAYLLFHQNGIQCLANFSIHMQMPCVCITEADLKRLVAENPQTIEANDGYYHLSTESRIDADSYRIWVNSLK